MNIEAGKYYKTRDGRKAFVAGASPFDSTDELYYAVGYVKGDNCSISWASDGRYADNHEDDDDLVAEWVEPPTPLDVLKEIVSHMDGWAVRSDVGDLLTKAKAAIAAVEAK